MGVVYRARDERLPRDVAVKVIAPDLLADDDARRRFRDEALALSKLNHPNVETIHDFERHDGLDVIVAEYVPGRTLTELVRDGPLDERDAVRLGTQLAHGLSAVHEQGIVHRDLKPGNLRVTPDQRLKILDFGLAERLPRLDGGDATTLRPAAGDDRPGTPRYMSPERIRGGPPDVREDVYGAGTVLYEMATGVAPFRAPNLMALTHEILDLDPSPPRALNPLISADFEHVILKALEKDPGRRHQTAAELAADLERLGSQAQIHWPAPRPRRRRAWAIAAAAGLAVLGTALFSLVARDAAPTAGPGAGTREWVAIGDFAGCARGAEACDALREALTIALEQSRFLNVLPRPRVVEALRRMERSPDSVLDEATGLDLCRRERVSVLLTGRVATAGTASHVTVRALAADGRLLFTVRETATGHDEVVKRIDALSRRVRQQLGESSAQIGESPPLQQVTTRSTAALERYSRAVDLVARGEIADASAALLAAVALDPEFGMAHHQLAAVYNQLGEPAKERVHLERAHALRSKLTDRERLVIAGRYHSLREEYGRAVENLQTLAGLYPDDPAARYELARALTYVGRRQDGVVQFRQALRSNPYSAPSASGLVLLLAELGENDAALAVADEARARQLETPHLQWGRAMALMGQGETGAARRTLESLSRGSEEAYRTIGELYLTRLAILEGRFRAAREELTRAVRADRLAGRTYPEHHRRFLLGRLALLASDRGEAMRQAQALVAGAAAPRVEDLHYAGFLQVLAGDVTAARGTLQRLRTATADRADAFGRSCTLLLDANILSRLGRGEPAERYREAYAAYPTYLAHQGLAEWLETQGDWHGALSAWRRVVEARGEVLRHGFPADWVLAHLRAARAARRLGRTGEALDGYRHAIEAWKEGDADTLQAEIEREWRTLAGTAAPVAGGTVRPIAPVAGRVEKAP
jgi:tetratricopeptide (TPR) repeat protein